MAAGGDRQFDRKGCADHHRIIDQLVGKNLVSKQLTRKTVAGIWSLLREKRTAADRTPDPGGGGTLQQVPLRGFSSEQKLFISHVATHAETWEKFSSNTCNYNFCKSNISFRKKLPDYTLHFNHPTFLCVN